MQKFQCLKEKFGLCPYGVIYDKQEFILPEIQDDIEELKKENEKSKEIKNSEESTEESMKIKTSEEPIEIKSPKEDEIRQIGMIKINSKKYQLLLIVTNLIIQIKQVN